MKKLKFPGNGFSPYSKEEDFMKRFKRIIFTITAIMVFCCISMPKLTAAEINYNRMNLSVYVTSKILPLDNLEGNLNNSQANRIMKNGFLTTGKESYGYFRINLRQSYMGEGRRSKSVLAWYVIGSALTFGLGTTFLPVDEYRYNLSATVEILDARGKVIKDYSKTKMFESVEWIYSKDYTYETESIYRELLTDCLKAASRDADKINAVLINAKMSERIPKGARIAVIGANQSADVIQGTRMIEAQLIDAQRYQIVDRVSIDTLISEIIFSRSVYVNEAIEVGRMLSAQYIVYTEVTGGGANKMINFRVVYVETGEVIASFANSFF